MFFNREYFIDDVLAVSSPGECAKMAVPVQLDLFSRASHQLCGNTVVSDRKLELVGFEVAHIATVRFEAGLDHFALVGLKDHTLLLEIVEVSGVHSATVDEKETEKDECRQCDNGDNARPSDDFRFDSHDEYFVNLLMLMCE